jgi:hypothetical protein
MPAKLVLPPAEPIAVGEEGEPDINRAPVAACPRCGGVWFLEIVQYRVVPAEMYAAAHPELVVRGGVQRARIVVAECQHCRQLVELPRG